MTHLTLEFKIPSYVNYEHYIFNGSRSPNDVTESLDGNLRVERLKVSKRKEHKLSVGFKLLKQIAAVRALLMCWSILPNACKTAENKRG